jgi:WD domain, G-beta repeat
MFGAQLQQQDHEIALPQGSDTIQALNWSPSGAFICTGGWDNKSRVWQVAQSASGGVANSQRLLEVDLSMPVLDVAWKDDSSSVFAVGCNKLVKLWNLQTNQCIDVGTVSILYFKLTYVNISSKFLKKKKSLAARIPHQICCLD